MINEIAFVIRLLNLFSTLKAFGLKVKAFHSTLKGFASNPKDFGLYPKDFLSSSQRDETHQSIE